MIFLELLFKVFTWNACCTHVELNTQFIIGGIYFPNGNQVATNYNLDEKRNLFITVTKCAVMELYTQFMILFLFPRGNTPSIQPPYLSLRAVQEQNY